MKHSCLTLIALSCLLAPVAALAAPICAPLTGADGAYTGAITPASNNCNTIITIAKDGTLSFNQVNSNPYDGVEDQYIGVVNNSASSVSSLSLTGTGGPFGFEGDGIDAFGIAGNLADTTVFGAGAYGGPNAFFSGISSGLDSGTVNFINSIGANGGTGFFSLEGAPGGAGSIGGTVGGGGNSPVPEPSSLLLLATGVAGIVGSVRRRLMKG